MKLGFSKSISTKKTAAPLAGDHENSSIGKHIKKINLFRKRSQGINKKLAQPPGTLIHVGEKKIETVTFSLIRYNQQTVEEIKIASAAECRRDKEFKGVTWLNTNGLHNTRAIETIADNFKIHSLVQEDILDTLHRPKFEHYNDYLFVVLKMIRYDRETKEIVPEQVSLLLGRDFVLTFQERDGDVFTPIRERLHKPKSRIRKMGADYLFYALIDAVVDNYFIILEVLGEEIELLEEKLLENSSREIMQTIHRLKREMIFLRKATWPLREIINGLIKEESRLFKKSTEIFLRDIYDHTIQVIETCENYRDMVAGLQELYLSNISNKMNEVMKVLTIIATIFIPITFIVGIYGMNFQVMPELKWKFGYFAVWGIIIATVLIMVLYFKRKKWL